MRVDPCSLTVSMNGQRRDLQPRVMQVLIALAQARPAVVSRDRLAALCWEGRVVGDDALNRCILALRHLAQEFAPEPFAIETVPRVGHRLVEALAREDADRTDPGLGAHRLDSGNGGTLRSMARGEKQTPVQGLGRREVMIGGAAAVAATATGAGWAVLRRDRMPHEARVLVEDARNSLYQFTPDQIENAVGKLRRATQLAPDSAEAWGLLSLAYVNSTYNAPTDQRAIRFERSKESRRRAFSIEPHQPDALAAELGTSRVFRNWHRQEQGCRAALRRHPDHPVLHVALGHLLLEVGRFEESLSLFEASLRRTPLCVTSLSSQIVILWGLGRFEEADAALAHAFALMPRQPAIWFARLHYFTYTDRAVEAAAMVADIDSRPIGIPDGHYDLAAMQANALVSGDQTLIRKTVEAYGEAARRGTGFAENAAMFAAFVGSGDESFRILNALYFDRGFRVPEANSTSEQGMYSGRERRTNILFRHAAAAVRRHPRFDRLTNELGLDDYWERTKSRSKIVT